MSEYLQQRGLVFTDQLGGDCSRFAVGKVPEDLDGQRGNAVQLRVIGRLLNVGPIEPSPVGVAVDRVDVVLGLGGRDVFVEFRPRLVDMVGLVEGHERRWCPRVLGRVNGRSFICAANRRQDGGRRGVACGRRCTRRVRLGAEDVGCKDYCHNKNRCDNCHETSKPPLAVTGPHVNPSLSPRWAKISRQYVTKTLRPGVRGQHFD